MGTASPTSAGHAGVWGKVEWAVLARGGDVAGAGWGSPAPLHGATFGERERVME